MLSPPPCSKACRRTMPPMSCASPATRRRHGRSPTSWSKPSILPKPLRPLSRRRARRRTGTAGPWVVEVYFGHAPERPRSAPSSPRVAGEAAAADAAVSAPWCSTTGCGMRSLACRRCAPGAFSSMAPMIAAACAANDIALEIEAALAFGTGHHGSTRGCLLMLDAHPEASPAGQYSRRRHRQRRAGARCRQALHAARSPPATSIPSRSPPHAPMSRLNGATPWLRPVVAKGSRHPALAPARLMIWSSPIFWPSRLRRLAPALAGSPRRPARSCFRACIARDVAGVLSAYRAAAFRSGCAPRHRRLGDAAAGRRGGARHDRLPTMRRRRLISPPCSKATSRPSPRPPTPSQGAARVAALRAELERRGLEGFIVPRADEQQNEYVPKSAERLAWLTGFTGSAGLAIVLKTKAAIFVDGRYRLQVREQVDVDRVRAAAARRRCRRNPGSKPICGRPGGSATILGCTRRLRSNASRPPPKAAGASLVAVRTNPIDAIWLDRPPPPQGAVVLHPQAYSGEEARNEARPHGVRRSTRSRRSSSATRMRSHGRSIFAVTISRIRRSPLAYCLVPATGRPSLYIERAKLSRKRQTTNSPTLAEIAEPRGPAAGSRKTGQRAQERAFRCRDSALRNSCSAFENAGGTADIGADPIALMKATKNRVELAGARAAHIRDGAAMTRFLAWFEAEAAKGTLTEIDAAAGARNLPPRHREIEGHLLSHDRRQRTRMPPFRITG